MAVYTDVSFEELEVFLASYDLGHAHVFKGIAEGVSNSNYYLQTSTGAYILTLYEKRVERDDLPFYLGLMEHLARAGIRCPTPVHSKERQVTGMLNGRPAAILTFLDGVSLRRPTVELCTQDGARACRASRGGRGLHRPARQFAWACRMEEARCGLRGQGGFGRGRDWSR